MVSSVLRSILATAIAATLLIQISLCTSLNCVMGLFLLKKVFVGFDMGCFLFVFFSVAFHMDFKERALIL